MDNVSNRNIKNHNINNHNIENHNINNHNIKNTCGNLSLATNKFERITNNVGLRTQHVLVRTCTHTNMYSYENVLVRTCTRTNMYSYEHVLVRTCTRTNMHSYEHILVRTCALYKHMNWHGYMYNNIMNNKNQHSTGECTFNNSSLNSVITLRSL